MENRIKLVNILKKFIVTVYLVLKKKIFCNVTWLSLSSGEVKIIKQKKSVTLLQVKKKE